MMSSMLCHRLRYVNFFRDFEVTPFPVASDAGPEVVAEKVVGRPEEVPPSPGSAGGRRRRQGVHFRFRGRKVRPHSPLLSFYKAVRRHRRKRGAGPQQHRLHR